MLSTFEKTNKQKPATKLGLLFFQRETSPSPWRTLQVPMPLKQPRAAQLGAGEQPLPSRLLAKLVLV